jgi:hypothetical protein
MATDLIRDILTRVQDQLLQRLGVPDELIDILTVVDKEVRHEYGGERHYIAKTCEEDLAHAAQRNNAIRRSWKNNEPITLIAQRHGISRQRVWQIIRG